MTEDRIRQLAWSFVAHCDSIGEGEDQSALVNYISREIKKAIEDAKKEVMKEQCQKLIKALTPTEKDGHLEQEFKWGFIESLEESLKDLEV